MATEQEQPILPEKLSPEGAQPLKEAPVLVPTPEKEAGEIPREAAPKTETKITPPETHTPSKFRPSLWKRTPPKPVVHDQLTAKVEKIMEEGLSEPFQRLSPIAKQEFKLRGEQTAEKISVLLRGTHIKIKKILQLIFEWLRLLPGINQFFLEQEAKIKMDKIIRLKKETDETNKNHII